ncbi:NUDIX hydrolase [Streptomyces inhibens]|uniref:NUDIX hydrolase n=1 Tax=Streptomyces inhibens TaxID=2293571 RepID=A0A371PPY2_STRIH|nr:NUDIX hydrolase [Streptomyces inhibens]REK84577.1 NUDIX hydrolase [Streptomyces inhibens]
MHTNAEFIDPPGRRIGALALIRNAAGAVLLVEKRYRKEAGSERPWGLVGGCARRDEDLLDAFRREVHEETGQDVEPGDVLTIHRMPANGESEEGYNFVCDGGVMDENAELQLPVRELSAYRFVPVSEVADYAEPYTVARIRAALEALEGGRDALPRGASGIGPKFSPLRQCAKAGPASPTQEG